MTQAHGKIHKLLASNIYPQVILTLTRSLTHSLTHSLTQSFFLSLTNIFFHSLIRHIDLYIFEEWKRQYTGPTALSSASLTRDCSFLWRYQQETLRCQDSARNGSFPSFIFLSQHQTSPIPLPSGDTTHPDFASCSHFLLLHLDLSYPSSCHEKYTNANGRRPFAYPSVHHQLVSVSHVMSFGA
ncbi:unnamed protein product [Acanthosepion pharaonis]|uniref:Uncharacterized protein n=1 Tax=Acanthosepion pharaonis TaxID=158019 RepID=A0A812B2X5_ACAPH|nr:unnamed protein product [Sepia pharaonis]